jgi:hypothetical protein
MHAGAKNTDTTSTTNGPTTGTMPQARLATIAFVLTACATGLISARAIKGLRRQLH